LNSNLTLTAVLFAGGESRRMGRDKATLILNGEPLWSRQLRTLRELRPQKILISARTRPVWCPSEVETALDEPPSRGPLSGLVAALEQARTTHLLALAIDLPHMSAAHLHKLWSLARAGIGVVPRNRGLFEPLCAIYPVEAISAAEELLVSKDVSLQGLIRILSALKQIRLYKTTKPETSLYLNANTPARWKRQY
jgi:molybdenum cofactor guanylyltransferase